MNIYYKPKGNWKGMATIRNLAAAAKVTEDVASMAQEAVNMVDIPAHSLTCAMS